MYTCELSKVGTGWKAEFRANQGYSLGYAIRLPSLCSPPQTSQATLPPTHAPNQKSADKPLSLEEALCTWYCSNLWGTLVFLHWEHWPHECAGLLGSPEAGVFMFR